MNLQNNIDSGKRITEVILFLNYLNSFTNQGLRNSQIDVPMKNNPVRSISNSEEKLKVNTKANVSSVMWKNPHQVMSAVIFETHFFCAVTTRYIF